jgi:PII-like signaling protein
MTDGLPLLSMQVFFKQSDEHEGKPLGEVLLHFLVKNRVGGATMLRAEAGFGARRYIQHPKDVGTLDEVPMVLMVVERETILRPLLPEIRQIIGEHTATVGFVESL